MKRLLYAIAIFAWPVDAALAQDSDNSAQGGGVHGGETGQGQSLTTDPAQVLDRLFGRLVQAEDESTAKSIEQAIWRLWSISGSPTADALMRQSAKAMDGNQHTTAIRILNVLVRLKPDFSEAWNRRATVHFLMRNYDASLADIEKVLELEPRHFGALSGRGMILREKGDETGALKAFRRSIRIHPHLPGPKEAVKELELKLEKEI